MKTTHIARNSRNFLPVPGRQTGALAQAAQHSPATQSLAALQRMADQSATMQRLQNPAAVQRMEEDELQGKFIQRVADEDLLQGKAIQRAAPAKTNNTGLPDNLKSGIENLSGMSMDHVQVHRNSDKPAAVQAHAYAQGSNIHLGPGQEKHLPHEAWHVVQQAQGRVKPTMQLKGIAVNDDAGLEKEADVMGAQAMSFKTDRQTRQRSDINNISPDNLAPIQGQFGFEIEVPIFFTADGGDGQRRDPGNAVIDQGAYEIKADHNQELSALASYANVNQNGNTEGFPHGPPIVELVSKPLDEFAVSETEVRDLGENMAHWTEAVHAAAAGGESPLGGNFFVGSDSPRNTLQSTMGYFQTTYGIKLSSVPDVFKATGKAAKKNKTNKPEAATQLVKAGAAGPAVVKAIKNVKDDTDVKLKNLATASELASLSGYASLIVNYLFADAAMEGGVGLGKNLIGDYFYKTDLGTLSGVLPTNVRDALRDSDDILTAFIRALSNAAGRAPGDDLLINRTITAWVTRIVNGGTDLYIQELKNPDSAIIPSEDVGPDGDQEAAIIMENREPQNLDPRSKSKRTQGARELAGHYEGETKTADELEDFLRDMTDPKKYAPGDWPSVMIMVHKLLRQING